jgi:galactonate dehydratase
VPKVHEYVEWFKGHSIFDIEWLRGKAYPEYGEFRRATSCAYSAIEQACYDLQGQAMGVPTHALFGGKLRDTVRNYANINRSTDARTPDGFAAMAQSAVDAGFDALKLASFDGMPRNGSKADIAAYTQLGIDCVMAAREVLGPDRDLLVDAHNHFDVPSGIDIARRLEPAKLFFLEEISRPIENLAAIHKAVNVTTAGGESLFGVKEFWPYIIADPVDILMPDVKYCGGMLELKKIAAMGEAAGMAISPHGPASPVGNMAAAQVLVTIPNPSVLECSHGDAPWRAEMVDPPEPMVNGILTVSERPGLGYKLNENLMRERLVSD